MAHRNILLDNMVVSWGIRGEANPQQQHLVGWTKDFLKQCEEDGVRLYLPAPVVAESLLRVPITEHETVTATYARYFRILPFDLGAAREFARLWTAREPALREADLRGGVAPKKGIYRFDCQIVAIALSRKLDCIYSHDRDVARFAGGEIDVQTIPEPPLTQVPLL
jgi:predicted nucleic acid-binding protein